MVHLEILLVRGQTCQDLHSIYHDKILSELLKMLSQGSNSYGPLINTNEYAFLIIDDDNPYTEIRLKMIDSPTKFMLKKSTINLYYLNVGIAQREYFNYEESGTNNNVNFFTSHLSFLSKKMALFVIHLSLIPSREFRQIQRDTFVETVRLGWKNFL